MDASKRIVRRASNSMMSVAASTGAAITSRTRRLSDAMKPDIDLRHIPQLKKKLSGALSRSDSQRSQKSQKSPEPLHRRRPSFQGGQLVPRGDIHYFPREEVLSPNHIGSRARSGDYGDLIDGVAIAEAARRDKERRFYGTNRQRSMSLDSDGFVMVRGTPSYAPSTNEYTYDARGPPSQPVPDSVLPGQKMRDSVNSIALSRTDSSASVYSQMSTATAIVFEMNEIDKGLRQFKIEKEIASGRATSRDARDSVAPHGASVQRKGAIKRNASSGSVAHCHWQNPYTRPTGMTSHSRTFSVEPADDLGRYPRIASSHSREPSSSSGSPRSSSRARQEQANPVRPSVPHSSTAPTRLPSHRPTAPPPQPIRWPTSGPEQPQSWYTSRESNSATPASSSRHERTKERIEGPPPSSSSGSSGYVKDEQSTHKPRKREPSSREWLSRPVRSSQDKLADSLLGGSSRHEREREPAVVYKILPVPPKLSSSSPNTHRRPSSQRPDDSPRHDPRHSSTRPSSTRPSHRPPPLVNAFAAPLRRANTTSSATSSPLTAYPPTPPPIPTSSLHDPFARKHAPPLPLMDATPARRALRQEHAASTHSYTADEVGRAEWRESYRLGEENVRRRKVSESGRRRGEEEQRRAYF